MLNHFHIGIKNRIVASHKLNLASSRSHTILTLKLESSDLMNPTSSIISKLELVDLAGSERISLTGSGRIFNLIYKRENLRKKVLT